MSAETEKMAAGGRNGFNGSLLRRIVGDSWPRLVLVLLVGLGGGGAASTGLWASTPRRTDTEIRTIAKEVVSEERRVTDSQIDHLGQSILDTRAAVDRIDGKVDRLRDIIIERLPAP